LPKKIILKKSFEHFFRVHFWRKKSLKEKNGVKVVPDTPVSEYTKNRKNGKNEFCVFRCLAPFSHRFIFLKLFFSPKMNFHEKSKV